MSGSERDTRERLLDVAESLIAERGLAGTSLRRLTQEAGTNLAAVNYHFGSKDQLLRALIARRLEPMNLERLSALEAVERAAGSRGPSVEAILGAFLGPALRMRRDPQARSFVRLLGHAMTQPSPVVREKIAEMMAPVARRFHAAFARSSPELDASEVFWRLVFCVGAMSHILALGDQIARISGGLCDPDDGDGLVERMVVFLAAGMRAKGAA